MELSDALREYGLYKANNGKPDFITWLYCYHPELMQYGLNHAGHRADESTRPD